LRAQPLTNEHKIYYTDEADNRLVFDNHGKLTGYNAEVEMLSIPELKRVARESKLDITFHHAPSVERLSGQDGQGVAGEITAFKLCAGISGYNDKLIIRTLESLRTLERVFVIDGRYSNFPMTE